MSKKFVLLFVLFFLVASCLTGAKSSSAASASENSWANKASVPQVEGTLEATVVNGKIYVMGKSVNYEYDPETDSWVEKTPMPTPRTHFGIAVYQNKIYTLGAYGYSCANEVYDPATDRWETMESMPVTRTGIVASVVYGKIHLISPDSHDVYDVATDSWTTKEPMPYTVYRFGSAVVDNKIFVIGWNQTQIYDSESDTWSLGTPTPTYVYDPGVCATTGVMATKRIYVIGGSADGLQVLDSGNTQVYDPVSDSWTLGEDMLTACLAPNVVVVNDQIYAIGGATGLYTSVNTNQQYTPIGYGTPDPSYVVPDSTAPEVTLISPENKTYYDDSVLVEFSVNESVSWMSYSLDGNFTEVSGNTSVTGLSWGVHNLTVYARDAAGNIAFSQTIHFEVDEPFPIAPVAAASVVAVISVVLLVYFKKHKR